METSCHPQTEMHCTGGLLARYTHEGGSLYHDLVSMRRGGASYYFLFDGLGSVTEVVDGSENTQNSYRYEAWGQVQSSTENITNPYRYVGANGVHWDPSPALYFMQARYYAPDIGRFITPDPVRGAPQDPRSLHRYLYVSNDPATKIDATGLLSEYFCLVFCLAGPEIYWQCVDLCRAALTLEELRKELDRVMGKRGRCSAPEHFGDCIGCPGTGGIFENQCVQCCVLLGGIEYGVSCWLWCGWVRYEKQRARRTICRW